MLHLLRFAAAATHVAAGFAQSFSCKGILTCLNWFHGKGHEVYADDCEDVSLQNCNVLVRYVVVPQSRLDVEPHLQQVCGM